MAVIMNETSILRKKAVKSAVYGAAIAITSILIATLAAAQLTLGNVSLATIIEIQKTNVALWILDVMPFIFMVWGQYVGSMLIEEADSMIIEQTHEMWHEARQLHEKIKHENNYDTLTQLPNTQLFLENLDQLILNSAVNKNPGSFIHTLGGYVVNDHHAPRGISVILLDIDNFKEVNSTLGTHNGDLLIKAISLRLKNTFKDSGIKIARIGGDDFGILKAKSNDVQTVAVIQKIREIFRQPFDLNGISLVLEASIGVSIYPQHGDTSKDLLQHAEIAMYACKRESKEYVFYNPNLNAYNLDDLILKTDIRRAFDQHELCLHYQPKVNRNNQINEVEALVRWQHPSKGLIPPDTFIPIILRQRLNGELLQRILDLALKQAKAWEQEGIKLRIALNLTSFDLLDADLPKLITDKLMKYQLSTDVLKLELTETTLIENQELTLKILTQLSAMGIPISIDDFGTGYSSLSYLSSLPIDEVKIDRSFVIEMPQNHRNQKIVQAIIALGHSLSLSTVAEGVEDAETMAQLKHIHCDFIQGFYISKPLEGAALTLWLKNWEHDHRPTLIPHHRQVN